MFWLLKVLIEFVIVLYMFVLFVGVLEDLYILFVDVIV